MYTMASYKHDFGQTITTNAEGYGVDRAFLAHINIPEAAAAKADAIIDGAKGPSGEGAEALVVDEFDAQPAWPRNITVSVAATTLAHIAAGIVKVEGINFANEAISENFTVTAATATGDNPLVGDLAFKKVTKVTIPVQNGDSVTFDVGWGAKFGIPYKLYTDELVILKLFNKAVEDTEGTVTADASDLEKNVYAPNGTPNGTKDIDLYIIV